ncbi:Protoporphyrinogen IX oxidase, aerobic [Mycobacterium tuberculosis variant bovis BCG str. ATCC 35743]|nr:Protoporphyrinogen IX oxidase, aerobic [Mycobacterium tuberculosis variant bovis BCG str. ATCC 35743]
MTSAYRLRQAVGDDATITLFEPADRLGGVLRTEHIGGQPMDLGAEAFVLRRPEMPALLAELGLSDRQLASTGARPLIYSQQRLHPLPPQTVVGIPSSAGSMAGLVDDATLARIDAEAARPFTWQVGSDPAVADLVADRFGDQVVARSVDPLLSGVYAGSAATIGLRAAAPSVAAALDRGATSVTDAVRQALPPGGPGWSSSNAAGCCATKPAAAGRPTPSSWRFRRRGWRASSMASRRAHMPPPGRS